MKNQTDLIVIIVASVFTVGAFIGTMLMKRDVVVLPAPAEVVVTPAPLPAGDVVFADALPGGGSNAAGGGGAGRGRGPGGGGGFGGSGAAGRMGGRRGPGG